ncbi:MAG: glycine--tRNA ligase subunit beta [Deltaproteobacteria bacterium]|jgi:glycyl-tRNA synthetase beta chain|nr:glycine--tRNA ligase subunit beta [Deltaproteobacteria bacterium]MBW2530849.1 glycine--tRNA ligase subunit beta [Deltaproteobacteria bacterium]
MSGDTQDLLFEIGCEELPASFVEAALEALPHLTATKLAELRLAHGAVRALGTPRRLAVMVSDVTTAQAELEEEVVGPPMRVAFRDGAPTKAAEAFAAKVGCDVDALTRVDTPKGEYLAGTRREAGRPALELLPEALAAIAKSVPFRKSMRWGHGAVAFGRPVRWLVALLGSEVVPVEFAGARSGRESHGHRFLHPSEVTIATPDGYERALLDAHVIPDPAERGAAMRAQLLEAAAAAGGTLIEDEFLHRENLSLVEKPHVVVGSFDAEFLELPDDVILEVARGHQRYFCLRGADGALLPKYLAVVNTAERPDSIAVGNDRVMRARLADARFFYREDLKQPLATRREELGSVVFQDRLGSVLDKVERSEQLVRRLGELLGTEAPIVDAAASGLGLGKCDLVTLMVGEFPELQGKVGEAYARVQGVAPEVAEVIVGHYQPKGAKDHTASTEAAALAAVADRLDTLVGCFGVGLAPTGATDPYGLRRACLGTLRTLLDRRLDLPLSRGIAAAYQGYRDAEVALDLREDELGEKLAVFFHDRLRGLLADGLAADAVDAALGVAADRPLDVRSRTEAILGLDAETRAKVGEVFKRATNIAKQAPEGRPQPPAEVVSEVADAERALFDGFLRLESQLTELHDAGDYAAAFGILADFTPVMARYFEDVFVMDDDPAVRDNRLRMMRTISETCSMLADLHLLGAVHG